MTSKEAQMDLAWQLNTTVEELNRAEPCYMNHCNGFLQLRVNSKDGSLFFGCSNYPECKATSTYDTLNGSLTEQFLGVRLCEDYEYGEEPF
jgi:ssDNA-binding Zn-finger/Zn-ribbon topoisomerase 1